MASDHQLVGSCCRQGAQQVIGVRGKSLHLWPGSFGYIFFLTLRQWFPNWKEWDGMGWGGGVLLHDQLTGTNVHTHTQPGEQLVQNI